MPNNQEALRKIRELTQTIGNEPDSKFTPGGKARFTGECGDLEREVTANQNQAAIQRINNLLPNLGAYISDNALQGTTGAALSRIRDILEPG